MRHAGPATLDELEPLLATLRQIPALVEKKRGIFYRASRSFVHFHEDPTGPYADVRFTDDFERVRVATPEERESLMKRISTLFPA